jgi:DNA-binding transcriptional LysR family regulator
MEATETAISNIKGSLSGKVIISCSLGVAQFAIKELLIEFIKRHPNIEVIEHVSNQNVDLISSGVDMVIRGHMENLPDSSIIQRHLSTFSWCLYASPSYFKNTSVPQTPKDLNMPQGLKVGWQSSLEKWNLTNTNGKIVELPFSPTFCSDDMSTLKKAAVEGLGIVSLPAYTCRAEVNIGTLIRVLPQWTSGRAQLSLLTPSRTAQSPAAKALAKYLLDNLENHIAK